MVDQFSMIRLRVYSFIIPTNIQCVGADLTTDKSIMRVHVRLCVGVYIILSIDILYILWSYGGFDIDVIGDNYGIWALSRLYIELCITLFI